MYSLATIPYRQLAFNALTFSSETLFCWKVAARTALSNITIRKVKGVAAVRPAPLLCHSIRAINAVTMLF